MKKISIAKFILYLSLISIMIAIIILNCNYKIYIITSGSMQPTLQVNELIVVKKAKKDTTYQVGDIITYCDINDNSIITHRIVRITQDGYYTKGDFNNIEDLNVVANEQIIGKLVYNSLFLGNLYVKYKFILLLLLIGFIVVLNFLQKERRCLNETK